MRPTDGEATISSPLLPWKLGILAALAVGAWLTFGVAAVSAAPGDAGTASYKESSATNTYEATITNTGGTAQRYDYVKVPDGTSVTGCAIVSASKASSCNPNGAGQGTAEAILGGGGLPPNGVLVFSFTTNIPIPCGTALDGGINSTGNSSQYTIIPFPFSGSCGGSLPPDQIVSINLLNGGIFAGHKVVPFLAGRAFPILTLLANPMEPSSVDFTVDGGQFLKVTGDVEKRTLRGYSGKIAPGKSVKVRAKAKKKAINKLKAKGKLVTRVTVKVSDANGVSNTVKKKLTFKAPKH